MVKAIKFTGICLVLLGLMGVMTQVFAQEKNKTEVLSGELASVDLEKSEIVVRELKDKISKTYENITFKITTTTKITKQDVNLNLSDLTVGDKVIVKYTTDDLGNKNIETITVSE